MKLAWVRARVTKRGRIVSQVVLARWASAKSGVSHYLARFHVDAKLGTFRPDRYTYILHVDFRIQFPARKTVMGTLEFVLDSRSFRKRADLKRRSFHGAGRIGRGMWNGTAALYRMIVQDLLLRNRAELPSYEIRKKGFRRYRRFDLRIRAERIAR